MIQKSQPTVGAAILRQVDLGTRGSKLSMNLTKWKMEPGSSFPPWFLPPLSCTWIPLRIDCEMERKWNDSSFWLDFASGFLCNTQTHGLEGFLSGDWSILTEDSGSHWSSVLLWLSASSSSSSFLDWFICLYWKINKLVTRIAISWLLIHWQLTSFYSVLN